MRIPEVRPYWEALHKRRGQLLLKRGFDFVMALILLALLVVPMAVIAILIKLDSDGSVFYRQERITTYGKRFHIHKFRTMVVNNENDGVPQLAEVDDERLTKFGKFLRSLYWNPTDTPMKYSNCKIGQIEIDVKSRYKLILPGGLKYDINTTPQDVLDMYGDPYRLSEQDTYTEITYMQGEFSRVDFYFYTQDEKMKENNYVILQNFAG